MTTPEVLKRAVIKLVDGVYFVKDKEEVFLIASVLHGNYSAGTGKSYRVVAENEPCFPAVVEMFCEMNQNAQLDVSVYYLPLSQELNQRMLDPDLPGEKKFELVQEYFKEH